MLKVKNLVGLGIVLLGLNQWANAADWSDYIYWGYGTGAEYADFKTTVLTASEGNMDTAYSPTSTAWFNNIFFGVENQATDGWYWSLEANLNYANARGFQSNTIPLSGGNYEDQRVNVSADFSGDVDLLFGHSFDDENKWVGYGKIGPAVTQADIDYRAAIS